MTCRSCKLPIHEHQARRPALVAVHQSGERRVYHLCGECADRLESALGRAPYRVLMPALEPIGAD